MLPLDHLPFATRDLDGLAQALRRLGFTVSPRGRYAQPDGATFPNRCVFLEKGWFDLLEAADAPEEAQPGACLFLSPDLEGAREALAALAPSHRTFLLERRWDEDIGLPAERFRWMGLRSDHLAVQAAVIEHAWPCPDILPAWRSHPNGAVEVLGLALAAEAPGDTGLDTSGFRFLPKEELAETYDAERAVRVRVTDLAHARQVLSGLAIRERSGSLVVPPHARFACAFEFVDATQA